MGIPSYFSYIIKNYPKIISNLKTYIKNKTVFDNLYMDCNSIIYDSIQKITVFENNADFEQKLIHNIILAIEKYIQQINPTNTIFIAFDGVAPFAKMNQQKTRRYKSAFMSTLNYINKKCDNESIESNKTQIHWSTSNITPGTQFMDNLSIQINNYFQYSEKKYHVKKIIVSGSNEVGEGEHKIFKYIRENPNLNENMILYGLDSDLIMLSIFHTHLFENGYIFREAPEFIKSAIELENYEENKNEPYVLDIGLLSNYILSEMNCKFLEKRRVYDYVFLCFFLGNDFLPHFPSLNIRTHGIPMLLDIYAENLGKYNDRYFISNKNTIQWKYVKIYVKELAKREHSFLLAEYSLRKKNDNREWKNDTEKDREYVFNSLPIIYRAEENYICPSEKMWEERYYQSLFHLEKTENNIKNICNNYLEALEWVYYYYSNDCKNWKWTYEYHYPPLLIDLQNYIPDFETEFLTDNSRTKAYSPYVQLAYVLPKEQLHLLPLKQQNYLMKHYKHLYSDKMKFTWAFCRYFWEAHVDFQKIPKNILDKWEIELVEK